MNGHSNWTVEASLAFWFLCTFSYLRETGNLIVIWNHFGWNYLYCMQSQTDEWEFHLLYLGPKLRPLMLQLVSLVSGWKPHLNLASWWHVDNFTKWCSRRPLICRRRARERRSIGVIWDGRWHTRAQKQGNTSDRMSRSHCPLFRIGKSPPRQHS